MSVEPSTPATETKTRWNKPLIAALAFGVIAATLEMGALLWFLYR